MDNFKHDEGKLRYSLLDFTFLKQIVKIREYGVKKYRDPEGWKKVPDAKQRYKEALLRHIFAWAEGEEVDPESGLPHLAHAACNIMFIFGLKGELL